MVFWAFRDKRKAADGARRGFPWYVALVHPLVARAADVVWRAWHVVSRRAEFQREAPSFLCANVAMASPLPPRAFNAFLREVLASKVENPELLSTYSLRRSQRTAMDVRDADWNNRYRLAAWAQKGRAMHDCMPVRYSGARPMGNLKLKLSNSCGARAC